MGEGAEAGRRLGLRSKLQHLCSLLLTHICCLPTSYLVDFTWPPSVPWKFLRGFRLPTNCLAPVSSHAQFTSQLHPFLFCFFLKKNILSRAVVAHAF